jgi:hypothetical protein
MIDHFEVEHSEVFQNELGVAAASLVRTREGLEGLAPIEPRAFFGAVVEIAEEFYGSYAPNRSLKGFLNIEIIECVTFAVDQLELRNQAEAIK